MNFYKYTQSYKMITLLEKGRIRKYSKYKYLLLYLLQYISYSFKTKRRIKKTNILEKMDLFIELFKEYAYLQNIMKDNKIESNSDFDMNIVNNNIIGNIYYKFKDKGTLCIHVEYDLYNDENNYCIYIDTSRYKTNTTGFNITEQNLKNNQKRELFDLLVNMFFSDILLIMMELYELY